jgi:histidine triad (HIT) family protein
VSCIFCAIVAGAAPVHVVHEDEHSLAFLDIHPATRGHCLVVPRRHADDLWAIEADDLAHVARTTHVVADRLRNRLQPEPEGITLFQANRRAGWQDVFHLHVHVVPRYRDDGLVRPWTLSTTTTAAAAAAGADDDLAAVAAALTTGYSPSA